MKLITVSLLFNLSAASVSMAAPAADKHAAFDATKQYTNEMLGESSAMSGKVLDIIDVASYTYVQFSHGKGSQWLATNQTDVKKGDIVSFENAQSMQNFHSKSLNRTFDQIYFVSDLTVKR